MPRQWLAEATEFGMGVLGVWIWPSGGFEDGRCGSRWRGAAAAGKAAGFWDAAIRSIIACCVAYMTQTVSDIPSPLKTSLEKLRELETWHSAGLDVAKLALRIPPPRQPLCSGDIQAQQTLFSPFALWVMSDLYSSPTCITFVYFCNILKYSNIPCLGGSLEGE